MKEIAENEPSFPERLSKPYSRFFASEQLFLIKRKLKLETNMQIKINTCQKGNIFFNLIHKSD